MATEVDAQDMFRRAPNFGIRCVRYPSDKPLDPSLLEPVERSTRDYSVEAPVSDEKFDVFRRFYSYDFAPLNDVVVEVDEAPEFWRRETVSFDAAYGNEKVLAQLLLPKTARSPYQTVVVFPGSDAFFRVTSADAHSGYTGLFTSFLARTGRALVYPVLAETYERRGKGPLPANATTADRDLTVRQYQDLARTMDYLETRTDVDHERVAYFGVSRGAALGPIMLALEPRFRTAVLRYAGLPLDPRPPEADPINFTPRVTLPLLMINGRHDQMFPVETSQNPLYRWLGTPVGQKRHAEHEGGHQIAHPMVVKETLDWLDQHLGSVK
jgi:predicted esterase